MPQSIRKILIANRGEIARRVARTCRRLGIATVAVYSDADRDSPFVREADEAYRLGPASSSESYLRIDRLLDAGQATGADAVHPGYGFLSENAAFAEACAEAGMIFIGPTPAAIASMGSKQRAKRIMADAGVPVIPGYEGAEQDVDILVAKAGEIGFPILVKASAGGGGKGLKRVDAPEDLANAIASARREALGAFGDDTLLLEKYLDRPRHVEIQVLGDAHGNVVHLNERECSIQRRHQKIIEESPSPALDADLRARMADAAVQAAKAIGYQNAGTVELLLDADRSFYFLEVNTRLQVEHPVTELVTGLDLVEQQIRVAEGWPLSFSQEEVPLRGAAIEARLYAEDADKGFLPQTGRIIDFVMPRLEGVRVDSGVETGSEVSVHYDPMLAKIIANGEDRPTAIRRLRRALSELCVHGVTTNRAFLLRLLDHPAFLAGELDTHFIERHSSDLEASEDSAAIVRGAILATLDGHRRRQMQREILPSLPTAFRNGRPRPETLTLSLGERKVEIEYFTKVDRRTEATRRASSLVFELRVDGQPHEVRWVGDDGWLSVEVDGHSFRGRVVRDGSRVYVSTGGEAMVFDEQPRFPGVELASVAGGYVSPMPGKVIAVDVEVGAEVKAGEALIRMEAMKMEHTVCATTGGVVKEILVSLGDQVSSDALLIIIQEA